jgi:hypothetical protein
MVRHTSFVVAVSLAMVDPVVCRAQVITFDASSTGQARNTRTLSWTHTVGPGNNRLLVVGIATEASPIGSSDVFQMFYGGFLMNHVSGSPQRATDMGVGTENYADLWYQVNPPVGTSIVQVFMSTTVADVMGGAASFFNLKPIFPNPYSLGGAATQTSAFSTLTASITTNQTDSLVVDIGVHSTGNGTMTPGPNQIEAWDQSTVGARSAFSYRIVPTMGTVTDSWTADGNPAGRMAMSLAAFLSVSSVPEPSAVVLAGAGGLLLAAWRRRRGRVSQAK